MDILANIRRGHDLDQDRWPGLRFGNTVFTQKPRIRLENIANSVWVDRIGGQVSWGFEVPDYISDTTSLRSSTADRVAPRHEEYKIRHEFVAEGISMENTDKRLDSTFPFQNDSFDNLTPDWMMTDADGDTHVIELGTWRNTREHAVKNEFDKKVFKYQGPLACRATDRIITFTVIIVTEEFVMSNLILPMTLVDDLCARMSISIALENNALGKGIDLKVCQELNTTEKLALDIGGLLDEVEFKDPEEKNMRIAITKEYYDKVMNHNVDMSLVTKLYLKSRDSVMNQPSKPDHQRLVQEFKQQFDNPLNERREKKPTCIFPLVCLEQDSNETFEVSKPVGGDAPGHIISLWKSAMTQAKNTRIFTERTKEEFLAEAYCEDKEEIEKLSKERLGKREKYHRVDLSRVIDNKVRRELQKDGLFGKAAKDVMEIKVRREKKKLSFHWDTDLDDIEKFINSEDMYRTQDEIPWSQNKPLEMVEEANRLTGNTHFNLSILREWMKTNWFRSLDIISDIASELCLSIKQNTRKDDMIVKKLRNYPIYMLIKTTNSDSHLFFSLFIPESESILYKNTSPFRKLHTCGDGYVTDFVSVKKDKLANFLNASSRFITLVSFWCDFYGITSLQLQDFKENKEAMRMMNISLLVSLENKSETEESITQSRYMYMEVFKSILSKNRPNPLKILAKLSSKPRSRLNLWVIRQLVQNFHSMCIRPPTRKSPDAKLEVLMADDSQPGDKWNHLLNFFTGSNISSATGAVQLMYLGYLKDKNEEAEGNAEWSLVEKIVEEEIKLKRENRDEQYGDITLDSPLPKGKGFSMDCVLAGVNLMKKRLSDHLGPDWKAVLHVEIMNNLARQLTHEISTLKASSMIDHERVRSGMATLADQKHIVRIKVLEAIASKIDLIGMNPMLNLEAILELVESTTDGVVCDLFKKQQHGGLREIYVLTIESRILQLFIETISRTICDYFDEETLTHPENKLKNLDEHKVRSYKIAKARASVFADFCSSSDKTRWNQNFIMTAMCIPLFQLTNANLHPMIQRVLNLWSTKLIKLPPYVVKLLMTRTQLSSDSYCILYNKFHSEETDCDPDILMDSRSAFLKLTTGMMQGILHYTSSLLHVSYLQVAKFITLTTLKKKHGDRDMRFTMTSVCSSDDSATILTAFSPKDAADFEIDDVRAFLDCDVALEALTVFCRYFCFVESVKSTTALFDYVEFNSEFIFKNTIAIPTIKFVAACLTITESESMINRQYELYNLISALATSGFPSINTHLCQIAQALLHYKTLGSSTSKLFDYLTEKLKLYPDPVHGFFLLDSDVLCGVLGSAYSRWCAFRKNQLLRAGSSYHEGKELAVVEDGTIVDSLVVRHGEHKRWYKLLDRVVEGSIDVSKPSITKDKDGVLKDVNKEIVAERVRKINSIPELLYRHPEDQEELKIKLMCKALSPGVSKSLQKGNPLTQSFASTAYTLYSHCFTRTSTGKTVEISAEAGSTTETRQRKSERFSLLSSLKERMELAQEVLDEGYQVQSLEVLFPLHHSFLEATEVVEGFSEYMWVPTTELRQKKNIIRVVPRTDKLPFSLMQIMTHVWFSFSIKASRSVVKRCYDAYKLEYKWLRDTLEETLEASPFELHTELHGFVSSQSRKPRTFVKVGPAITTERYSNQIQQLVRKCSLRNYFLEPVGMGATGVRGLPRAIVTEGLTREKLESELSLALFIPIKSKRDLHVGRCLDELCEKKPNVQDWMGCPRWEFEVGMIALYYNNKITSEEVFDALKQKQAGIKIMFTKDQKKKEEDGKEVWYGKGECLVDAEGIEMRLQLEDKMVTKVYTRDPERLRRNPELMQEVFKRLGCRSSTKETWDPRVHSRFDGSRFNHATCPGTPVIHDPELTIAYTYSGKTNMRVNYGGCGIMCVTKGHTFPLVYFTSKKWACTTRPSTDTVEELFWSSWVHQRTAKVSKSLRALKQMDAMISDDKTDCYDRERVRGWAKESLENRLNYKGIGLANYGYAESAVTSLAENPVEDPFEVNMWLMDILDDNLKMDTVFQSYTQTIVDDFNTWKEDEYEGAVPAEEELRMFDALLDPKNPESLYRPVISNFYQEETPTDRSIMTKDHLNYFALHPIWDGLISELCKSDPRFFEKVLSGKRPLVEQEIADMLFRILDIKQRSTEQSMMSRFMSDTEESEDDEEW